VAERVYDVVSLLMLLFVLGPLLPTLTWFHSAEIVAVVVVGATAVLITPLLVARDQTLRLAARLLARLPFVAAARAERAVTYGAQGFASMLRLRIAITALFWTIASWLAIGLSYWLVMLAFDLRLSPLAGLLVCIAVGLGMALPSSPGAVGVFEVAAVAGASAYGVASSTALSYALVLHAVNFVPYLVIGAVVLVRRSTAYGDPLVEATA
jgi:hypothetical protein